MSTLFSTLNVTDHKQTSTISVPVLMFYNKNPRFCGWFLLGTNKSLKYGAISGHIEASESNSQQCKNSNEKKRI